MGVYSCEGRCDCCRWWVCKCGEQQVKREGEEEVTLRHLDGRGL